VIPIDDGARRPPLGGIAPPTVVAEYDLDLVLRSDSDSSMKRLPITGTSLATPKLGEEEFKRVLAELGTAAVFDDAVVHDVYVKLAAIHGAWLAEQEAKQVPPIASALRRAGTCLIEIAGLLSGHETGFQTHVSVEATSQTARMLARDHTIGSIKRAHELIDTFKEDAAKISGACLGAYAELTSRASKDGRDAIGWYDEFTSLLLEIAKKAGIEPKLNKDRVTGKRAGWLFEAAQALEPFLDRYMRSPSPEACGKRLERSRKRLLNAHRQNPKSP
jgi:hypothetical protein